MNSTLPKYSLFRGFIVIQFINDNLSLRTFPIFFFFLIKRVDITKIFDFKTSFKPKIAYPSPHATAATMRQNDYYFKWAYCSRALISTLNRNEFDPSSKKLTKYRLTIRLIRKWWEYDKLTISSVQLCCWVGDKMYHMYLKTICVSIAWTLC